VIDELEVDPEIVEDSHKSRPAFDASEFEQLDRIVQAPRKDAKFYL
jgi:hypothetical protein